jgi:hypothetical protein
MSSLIPEIWTSDTTRLASTARMGKPIARYNWTFVIIATP